MQEMTFQEVFQGLFDALTDLKTAVTEYGYTPSSGICGEIGDYWVEKFGWFIFDEVLDCLECPSPSDLLADLMEFWPGGTGVRTYPIPCARGCTDDQAAHRAYLEFENRWVGEQLELRLELIDYLLNELSDYLEEANAVTN